jgi:hypothetical protein
MPEIVKLAHERRQNKLSNWKVNLLTPETVSKYIDMSTVPVNYAILSPQHKSDWIRVALLRKYGGAWIDSTIIINDPDALDRLTTESEAANSEFTGFTLFGNDTYIENWFMMAPKNSEIISLLYDEYTRAVEMGFLTFKKELVKEGIHINERIFKLDDNNVYLTQHSCIQTVIQKRLKRKPRMILKHAEETMFKLHTDCKWDSSCISGKLGQSETYKGDRIDWAA